MQTAALGCVCNGLSVFLLQCKCEMGSEFTFFRDDTAISEKVGVTVTSMQNGPARTTLLTIDSVTTADSGTYTCKTASGGGTTDVTMTVNGDETDAGGKRNIDSGTLP